MAENNINFVDITKGFRRLGNFPTFSDEVFSSYASAQEYATNGALGRSNAFCGQLVRVLPDSADEEPMIYIIDNKYKLVSSTETVATDSKLSVSFGFNSLSGSNAITIVVPAGFILNQITVQFIEGFANDDALIIASQKARLAEDEVPEMKYLVVSGTDPIQLSAFDTPNVIITDEDDSEFAIQSTVTFSEKTSIILFINTINDPLQRGRGIVKLN